MTEKDQALAGVVGYPVRLMDAPGRNRSLIRLQTASVLVVDDNVLLASVMRRRLSSQGLRVVTVGSVVEAHRIFESFRVGIFDIELGDGCGVDLAEYLSDWGIVSHVVFFTGGAAATSLARAHRLGEVFMKSADVTPLERRVLELARKPQSSMRSAT